MSPIAESVINRLDSARQKWWIFTLLSTAVMAAAISIGVLMVCLVVDTTLKCQPVGLTALFLLWLSVTLSLLVLVGRRLARSQRSLEATARRVEAEMPELGSELINLVQLSSGEANGDEAFREAAVAHAAARVGNVRFDEAANRESRWKRFLHCMQTPRDLLEAFGALALLIMLAIVGHSFGAWSDPTGRLLKPWDPAPTRGRAGEIRVAPGNTEVLVGASVDILGEVDNPNREAFEAKLFLTPEGEAETSVPMTPDEKYAQYKITVPSVLKPLQYRLAIGGSETKTYNVKVREKPTIEKVDVTYTYPDYLGRTKDSVSQRDADLEAPQGTVAELRIHPSVAIADGRIECDGQRYTGRVEEDGQLLVVELPLIKDKDTTFTVHMANSAGHTDPTPRVNRIHILPDKPPTVELLKPGRQDSAAPGAGVPMVIRAGDDYGVGKIRLEMKIKKEGEAAEARPAAKGEEGKDADGADKAEKPQDTEIVPLAEVQTWTKFEGTTNVMVNHRLDLPAKATPGTSVMVRAVAYDKRDYQKHGLDLKPQEAASGWHTIRVTDPDAKAQAALEQAENLRSAIFKILEKQIRARMVAGVILQKKELAERTTLSGDIRAQQVEIQKSATAVVQMVKETDKEERKEIKRSMNQLAFGEMMEAVQQCDELVRQKTLEGFQDPTPRLHATQDKIVEKLRKLLDVTRQAQNEALAEMKKRPNGDLPDDAKKKLEDLKKKMDEFLKQQKKVIEASESLAKKPTEDFSEEQEQALKALKAAEDEWAKFMKDFHSDLSKLPEQDFANGTMAKELVEIQTELKMAEDALLKKSADIAVPLEQLGYERAEEIKTNMEKWLPDTPDREKWSQEESLSDADKEAPMAELPGELEDLIGDLMEEEEDLMDEMEDVSSSAADSIDKGAGWDVADGPISNMSAKGATGNRLPNTSEIGGRSGEGRQGKSSGEFVGDESVGKGGRNTPARLTPDPIMKGQIKDHSKNPTGGATGGGKESGQGGEGLEGPQPNAPGQRDLARLAGKQAALRNKAEGVDAQFQVMNYHHTDLKKLIEIMAQVESDLKAGNYQNALRQRQVLAEKAANVKQFLEGEFEVRKDATANLPADIQKEMIGAMQDPSPPGWEELNRQYFDRLSTSGGGAGAGTAPAKPTSPKP